MAKRVLLLGLLLALVSCAAPTPQPLEPVPAGISPAAAESAGMFLASSSTALELQTLPLADGLEQVEDGTLAFFITYAPPPEGWFAVPLLREGLAVVTHSSISTLNISLDDLRALVEGRIENWAELNGPDETVQPILSYAADDLRLILENRLGWGAVDARAILAPTPEAALSLLADTPGGFALVPYSLVDGSVRLLRVEGVRPGPGTLEAGTYPLIVDLIAVSPEEPQGAARDWLGAWQAAQAPDAPDSQAESTREVPTATQVPATATAEPDAGDESDPTTTPPPTATQPSDSAAE